MFIEDQFPTEIARDFRKKIIRDVVIAKTASGGEHRNARWAGAKRQFNASTGMIPPENTSKIIDFWHKTEGALNGFRFKDWSDFTSAKDGQSAPTAADQEAVRIDAKHYQAVKRYGGWVYVVTKIANNNYLVAINGTTDIFAQVDKNTGVITLQDDQAASAKVTAGFEYDVPVRFENTSLEIEMDTINSLAVDINLIEIKL